MLAARHQRHAEALVQPRLPVIEIEAGDDEVVEFEHGGTGCGVAAMVADGRQPVDGAPR